MPCIVWVLFYVTSSILYIFWYIFCSMTVSWAASFASWSTMVNLCGMNQGSGGQTTLISYCLATLLYCIILHLYIYIVLLEVHTNQKCFQCERPREKRAVLRERKEALGSPVNKVDHVEGGS